MDIFSLKQLPLILLTVAIFITLDFIWLGVVAKQWYLQQLGYLATLRNGAIVFNLPVGLLIQAIIAIGLYTMISLALLHDRSLLSAVLFGGLAGFFMYATYDLTNLSFVKNWPLFITVVDITWGTTQGVLAGIYVYYLAQWLK